jgi:hypothetical protein
MAGLVPAIHAFLTAPKQDGDARDKRGHDGILEARMERSDVWGGRYSQATSPGFRFAQSGLRSLSRCGRTPHGATLLLHGKGNASVPWM